MILNIPKTAILILIATILLLIFWGLWMGGAKEYDCSDFTSHSKTVKVFEKNAEDVYNLDRDGDGIPCETFINIK